MSSSRIFQPTLPARGATCLMLLLRRFVQFQPTLPARGATIRGHHRRKAGDISTHAPRTGSDGCNFNRRESRCDFNPRSPHGERPSSYTLSGGLLTFQPTLPARGATDGRRRTSAAAKDFNPRSPHGERRLPARSSQSFPRDFNPRSPHGERLHHIVDAAELKTFQPTLPARGATAQSNNSVDQNHRLCTKSIPQNSPFEN